eukprot:TRINITY_DN88753_c0_g1_i1.p1 TRINITY_DN88753_c0_g1~~TRINITY_DN88753_c0_g1_i1.p1  ORF type:complete len:402 (-),score=61.74 TRINITY_DN88753_c0_g1_i1:44-1204(-)
MRSVAVRRLADVLLLLVLRLVVVRAVVHYENPPCQHDEVQGEVLGLSGYTCSPRCDDNSFNCPGDMPPGASASPQCMLQDVDKGAFCGLLCQVDAQCPSGAACKQSSQMGVGMCMYGANFADWARSATTRKLSLGWPNKGGALSSTQVAKTFQALQNLKAKFRIDDGDVDMLALKELLNSITPNNAPQQIAAPASSGSWFFGSSAPTPSPPALPVVSPALPVVSAVPLSGQNLDPLRATPKGIATSDFAYDVKRLESEASQGLPGLQNEFQRDLYLAEHLQDYGAATSLLRVVFIVAVIYVAVGSFIKYQTMGSSGIDMIPHIGFWMEYPKLVQDGMTYSKMLIDGAMGKSSSSGPSFFDDDLSLDGSIRGVPLGRNSGAGAFEAL